MSGIDLKVLGNGDLDRYRRLRLEALRTEPTAFGSSYEIEASAKADKYRDRLTGSPENYVLGAWSADQLVGIGGFVRDRLAALKESGVNALNVGFAGKTLKDRVRYCESLRNLIDAM